MMRVYSGSWSSVVRRRCRTISRTRWCNSRGRPSSCWRAWWTKWKRCRNSKTISPSGINGLLLLVSTWIMCLASSASTSATRSSIYTSTTSTKTDVATTSPPSPIIWRRVYLARKTRTVASFQDSTSNCMLAAKETSCTSQAGCWWSSTLFWKSKGFTRAIRRRWPASASTPTRWSWPVERPASHPRSMSGTRRTANSSKSSRHSTTMASSKWSSAGMANYWSP